MEIVMTMSDFHVPYHDPKSISVSLKLAKHLQPKILVLHEVNDWYAISRFNKDPKRKLQLQKELDISFGIRKTIVEALPKTRIIELHSNHNARLEKYLNSEAEELSQLRCLKIEELMGLNKLGIEYRKDFMFRGILWKHGDIVRQDSSYTCKAEFMKEGTSGCSGHTHRLGLYFKTLRGGKYVWVESGCMCKLDPEYVNGTANWQNGLAVHMFKDGKKHFQPKVVPIIKGEILWGNHLFKA